MTKQGITKSRECLLCGKLFTTSNVLKKYCSPNCRRTAVRKQQTNYYWAKGRGVHSFKSKCVVCDKKIFSGSKYCSSPQCQKVYMREYMRNRYNTDATFRQRMIDSAVKYNERVLVWMPHKVSCCVCGKGFTKKDKTRGRTFCCEGCKEYSSLKSLWKYHYHRSEELLAELENQAKKIGLI